MSGKRRKRKQDGEKVKPKADETFSHRPLAALGALSTDRAKAEKAAKAAEAAEAARATEAAQAAKAARRRALVPGALADYPASSALDDDVDDETLFAHAVDAFAEGGEVNLYEGKYGNREATRDARKRSMAPGLTEADVFAQEMAGVGIKRISAQRVRALPQRRTSPADSAPSPQLIPGAEPEESTTLDGGQRRLVERARRHERQQGPLPCVTLRGLAKLPALMRLKSFVEGEAAAGSRFVRVVTGKGKQSVEEPVLKRAAAHYFDDEPLVSLYAPDVTRDGNYGAYIVQLRTQDPAR